MRALKPILLAVACATPLAVLATDTPPADAGLHVDWMDKSVDPGKDFFSYANGGWQKANPIPAAYPEWGTFDVLLQQNQEVLRSVVEDLGKQKQAPGSNAQKVADFYASGMDEQAIEAAGKKPLQPELDRIAAIKDAQGLQDEIARLQMMGIGALFRFGQTPDLKDSSKVIGVAFQGGLSLPDKDYYLKDDDRFKKAREAYTAHVARMFQLLGDPADKAAAESATVMRMETALAQASMSRVDRRNPENTYHPTDRESLKAMTPDFSWDRYFANVGHPELTSVNIGMPDFFKAADAQLKSVPLADWQAYLRWHLAHDAAPYLSKAFVDEDFTLQSALTGTTALEPRWQRVLETEDGEIGFALGKMYVQKAFPPSSKQAVVDILHSIRAALHDDLDTLAWMSPPTRKAAQAKLALMEERIGYPDKWRDYSSLTIGRDSYFGNVLASEEFLQKRELDKIGKPVNKDEWSLTPPTVNAYYSTQRNNINFPAGILQPPFFDPAAPPAVNYGALGFVMGHEMTHGFDDQGALFDPHGNHLAKPGWWTDADYAKFQAATNCISDHFSSYTVASGAHVQGRLVTGEATADLGGLTLAYRAFHASKAYKDAKTIDGFTPDQQFFLGAAHVWAEDVRPERQDQLVTINPHPPGNYRVNGTLANMPQFQQAFGIKDGSPMVNKDRCVIW